MAFRTLAQLMGLTTPVPASTTKPAGHPDAECRFSPFGESATAENVNRPHYALGENTDDLNTRMTRNVAIVEIGTITLAGPFYSSITIDPAAAGGGNYDLATAGYVYLGGSDYSGGGAEEAGFLFQILNEDYSSVIKDGTYIEVVSTTPALGSGFYNGGLVTLTFNTSVPGSGATYRLILARDDNVGSLNEDAMVKGLARYSHRHPSYEAFTATFSDGTNSTGGDHNGVESISKLSTYTYGGRFLVKPGHYEWADLYTISEHVTVIGETLQWGATEADNSTMLWNQGIAEKTINGHYENVFLASLSSGRTTITKGSLRNVRVAPGALRIHGPINWVGGTTEFVPTGAGSPLNNGCWFDFNASGIVEDVYFKATADTPTNAVDIRSRGKMIFRNCTFDTNGVEGCHALEYHPSGTYSEILFENCTFIASNGGYCVHADSGAVPTFVDCKFSNDYGLLVYGSVPLNFKRCTFETGSLHLGGAITAVNTSTETITVAGDHSGLSFGDYIRIVGSTGNDGYYSVSSTSGTGPTDITVAGDITDATADGDIRYGNFEPIFSANGGIIEDVSFSVGDANIIRDTTAYPVIEIGGWHKNRGYGVSRVDGLKITATFDTTPISSFLTLYGSADDTPTSYDNISLVDLPTVGWNRASKSAVGIYASAWVEFAGAVGKPAALCTGRNINIDMNAGAASDSITDGGCALLVQAATVTDVNIDSTVPSTTGTIGGDDGLIVIAYESTIKNLHYGENSACHCGILCKLTGGSTLDGGTIYRLDTITDLLFDASARARIMNLQANIPAHSAAIRFLDTGQEEIVFTGNTFKFTAVTISTYTQLISVSNHSRITNNYIQIPRNTASAIFTTGSIVDSNIIDYDSGGATPSISNSGGTTGDNMLEA